MNHEDCYGTVRCYVGIYTGLMCNILGMGVFSGDVGNSCWYYSITTVVCCRIDNDSEVNLE